VPGRFVSGPGATVVGMSAPSEEAIARLEDQLDGALLALSGLGALDARQAERVAARMDRLASQLLEVSAPAPMAAVHERLETTPATADDFAALISDMGPADGEG
jgi:hypothetical protein